MPMGPGEHYTIFRLDRARCRGGLYAALQTRSGGAPPHWLPYISVANADDSAARAAQAGGKVLAPPIDVYDAGRMAVIQDPGGATFALWQPKNNPGVGIAGVDGTLCWADLMTDNPPRPSSILCGSVRLERSRPGQNDPIRIPAHQERRNLHRRHAAGRSATRRPIALAALFPGIRLRRLGRQGQVHGSERSTMARPPWKGWAAGPWSPTRKARRSPSSSRFRIRT
jgi:predicted enzyme related to lactoylglutathione lyase